MNRETSGNMDVHVNHDLSGRQNIFRDHLVDRSEVDAFSFAVTGTKNTTFRRMQ